MRIKLDIYVFLLQIKNIDICIHETVKYVQCTLNRYIYDYWQEETIYM